MWCGQLPGLDLISQSPLSCWLWMVLLPVSQPMKRSRICWCRHNWHTIWCNPRRGGSIAVIVGQTSGSASAVISDVSKSDSDTLSSAETDTDLEEQLLLLSTECWLGAGGHHSPQCCLVCQVGLHSKGDLQFHLNQFHPDLRMYQCADCESAFNNARDFSCHITNVYKAKCVKCKHCDYKVASWVHMHLHVQRHTSGMFKVPKEVSKQTCFGVASNPSCIKGGVCVSSLWSCLCYC